MILQLPNEVLREILSYVPNQLVVGVVCRKFYEISCSLKAYRLYLGNDSVYNGRYFVRVDDVECCKSIMRSHRKIESLHFTSNRETNIQNDDWQRLLKIIAVIGLNIPKFIISSRSIGKKELLLINLMPNLEKLEITSVYEKPDIPKNFQFQLSNLRELTVRYSSADVFELFERLPDNVLRKLTLKNINKNTRKYFGNQQALEEISSPSIDFLDLSEPRSTTLTLSTGFEYSEEVDHVCRCFKNLESLNLTHEVSIDLNNLKALKNLRKIAFAYGYEDIQLSETLESASLESFAIQELSMEGLHHVSVSCPNISELKLSYYRDQVFSADKVLRFLPRLERLYCNSKIFEKAQKYEHKNLKSLTIYVYGYDDKKYWNFNNLLNFIRGCTNLELFSINMALKATELKRLLMCRPNLKSLCVGKCSKEIFKIVKNHGNNLHTLHMALPHWNTNLENFKLKKINTFFDGQFTQFTFIQEYQRDEKPKLLIRKTGKEEKCCKLWPIPPLDVQHFYDLQ